MTETIKIEIPVYRDNDGKPTCNGCQFNIMQQPDFASQQEVWTWLSQGKNQVKHKASGCVYGFNGKYGLFNFTDDDLSTDTFDDYQSWKKHTPPHLISVNGVEVPAPLDSLDGIDSFWLVILTSKNKTDKISVLHQSKDNIKRWLYLGLCYTTKEYAIKRAEAMLKFEVVD